MGGKRHTGLRRVSQFWRECGPGAKAGKELDHAILLGTSGPVVRSDVGGELPLGIAVLPSPVFQLPESMAPSPSSAPFREMCWYHVPSWPARSKGHSPEFPGPVLTLYEPSLAQDMEAKGGVKWEAGINCFVCNGPEEVWGNSGECRS